MDLGGRAHGGTLVGDYSSASSSTATRSTPSASRSTRALARVKATRRKWAATVLDLRKQLADFERSIKPMGDAIPIGQLICMALRYRSDQKGYPQLALQSLENQSLFAPFWLIKKEAVCDQMSG